jgi:hypothetical protein
MSDDLSERRLAENELAFRKSNEKVTKELDQLKEAAEKDGHEQLAQGTDIPLQFYCECSNMGCRKRITFTPGKYKELHQNSNQFILVPGHEVAEVERVVFRGDSYIVVEKYKTILPDGKISA